MHGRGGHHSVKHLGGGVQIAQGCPQECSERNIARKLHHPVSKEDPHYVHSLVLEAPKKEESTIAEVVSLYLARIE